MVWSLRGRGGGWAGCQIRWLDGGKMRKRSLKLLFPSEEARPGLRLKGKKWREPGKASKKGDPHLGCLARVAQGQRA